MKCFFRYSDVPNDDLKIRNEARIFIKEITLISQTIIDFKKVKNATKSCKLLYSNSFWDLLLKKGAVPFWKLPLKAV